jgi:esterase/lipase superfamily enzyme
MRHLRRSALVPPLLAAALLFTGCATTRPLPPALYQGELATAFDALPPELRSTDADVLYATDRTPEPDDDGALQYGFGRSRSLAFGSAVVSLATDTTWDELVSWTRSQSAGPLAPEPILARVDELGRLPATPFPFVVGDDGRPVPSPDARIDTERAADGLRAELRRRLQLAANKVVTISIHGIQNSFADAMENAALIWHQLGRRNVPLVYS